MSPWGLEQSFVVVRRRTFLLDVLDCLGIAGADLVTGVSERGEERWRVASAVAGLIRNRTLAVSCYAGYCGPWLEDYWIDRFSGRNTSEFGVFVPLFVPWLKLWLSQRDWYFGFLEHFGGLVLPSFVYVTVSQNANGIEGRDGRLLPSNVLIVSAGGKGHVPFPLFAKILRPTWSLSQMPSKYDLVFMGSIQTHALRRSLTNSLRRCLGHRFFVGKGGYWKERYLESRAVLCPRGYGRTSFRLFETLQLGLVPIYVYDDLCWLPYYDSIGWRNFSLLVRMRPGDSSAVEKIATFVRCLDGDALAARRKRIRELYSSHFSLEGSLAQLRAFLRGGFRASDLRCSRRMFTH